MTPTHHTVLITGGATGIGFALAKKFHSAGNHVILVGRREEALRQAAAQLSGCLIAVADVSQETDRERLVRDFPNVSILVNNAGVQFTQPFATQTADQIAQEININLTAPAQLTLAFLPILTAQREAAVVNVSSGLAIVPKETCALYCASKAALHSFSQTLRWQLENTPTSKSRPTNWQTNFGATSSATATKSWAAKPSCSIGSTASPTRWRNASCEKVYNHRFWFKAA